MNLSIRRALLLALLALVALPSLLPAEGLSYRGWGPRAGLSADPDQIFGGVHFDLGEIVDNLRFQPNVEIGFGDNQTVIAANFGALWFFETDWDGWKPYAGGELGLTYQDFDDDHHRGGSDTDVALNAVGGIEARLQSDTRLFFEVKLGVVEEPDLKLMIGWTF